MYKYYTDGIYVQSDCEICLEQLVSSSRLPDGVYWVTSEGSDAQLVLVHIQGVPYRVATPSVVVVMTKRVSAWPRGYQDSCHLVSLPGNHRDQRSLGRGEGRHICYIVRHDDYILDILWHFVNAFYTGEFVGFQYILRWYQAMWVFFLCDMKDTLMRGGACF